MISENKNELAKGLHELFKYAFVTNCHLDNDQITPEDSKVIDTFDSIDLLENFKDLILNLLKFKKELKNQEKTTNFNSDCIEKLQKKHESEIKYYIYLEKELRTQLDNAKILEEKLLKNYENAITRIQSYENGKDKKNQECK